MAQHETTKKPSLNTILWASQFLKNPTSPPTSTVTEINRDAYNLPEQISPYTFTKEFTIQLACPEIKQGLSHTKNKGSQKLLTGERERERGRGGRGNKQAPAPCLAFYEANKESKKINAERK